MEQNFKTLVNEHKEKADKLASLQGKLNSIKKQTKIEQTRSTVLVEQAKDKFIELNERCREVAKELSELTSKRDRAVYEYKNSNSKMEGLRFHINDLYGKILEYSDQTSRISKDIRIIQDDGIEKETKLNDKIDFLINSKNVLEVDVERMKDVKKEVKSYDAKIKKLSSSIKSLEMEKGKIESENKERKSELDGQESELNDLKNKVKEEQSTLKKDKEYIRKQTNKLNLWKQRLRKQSNQ